MSDLNSIAKRLKHYADYKDISVRALERELNLTNGVIGSAIKRDGDIDGLSIDFDKVPELNKDWVLFGKGQMISYKGALLKLYNESGLSLQDFARKTDISLTGLEHMLDGSISVTDEILSQVYLHLGILQKNLAQTGVEEKEVSYNSVTNNRDKNVYFVPIPAVAGLLSQSSNQVMKDQLLKIVLPPDYTGINFVFEVEGDSMYPSFTNRDHIGCRQIETKKYFRFGEPYLLDIGDGGMLLKRVFKHPDPAYVILRSDNPIYQDIDVEINDIRHLFIVTTKLSKNVGRIAIADVA